MFRHGPNKNNKIVTVVMFLSILRSLWLM